MTSVLPPKTVADVIDQLKADGEKLFCMGEVAGITCLFIKKHPYSLIAKIRVVFKDSSKNYYIKIPVDADRAIANIKKEFDLLGFLDQKFPDSSRFGVIHPVVYFENPVALVTEEGSGNSFGTTIRNIGRLKPSRNNIILLKSISRACGEWLKNFQSIDFASEIPSENIMSHHKESFDFVMGQISRCLAQKLLDKDIASLLKKHVESNEKKASALPVRITGMHADFIPSNIITDGNKLQVIDFARFRMGPSCRDVANLLYSLDGFTVNPLFRPRMINEMKKEFLAGYGWSMEIENNPLFEVHQIREMLGGLLQLSKRIDGGLMRKLMFARQKKIAEIRFVEYIDSNRNYSSGQN